MFVDYIFHYSLHFFTLWNRNLLDIPIRNTRACVLVYIVEISLAPKMAAFYCAKSHNDATDHAHFLFLQGGITSAPRAGEEKIEVNKWFNWLSFNVKLFFSMWLVESLDKNKVKRVLKYNNSSCSSLSLVIGTIRLPLVECGHAPF